MMAWVSVPFTDGHYYGRGKRPNTELADNSLSSSRKNKKRKIIYLVIHNYIDTHTSFI